MVLWDVTPHSLTGTDQSLGGTCIPDYTVSHLRSL